MVLVRIGVRQAIFTSEVGSINVGAFRESLHGIIDLLIGPTQATVWHQQRLELLFVDLVADQLGVLK